MCVLVCPCSLARSCLTICGPMDCSSQAPLPLEFSRILEQDAISFSRGSSRPRGGTLISCGSFIGRQILHHQHHLGSPRFQHSTVYPQNMAKSADFNMVAFTITISSIQPKISSYGKKQGNTQPIQTENRSDKNG